MRKEEIQNANRQRSGPFKILLVLPDGRIHKLKAGPLQVSFREAPLTATMLAALIPPEIDARVTVIDESVSKIPWHKDFDLVGISCLTGTAPRAYRVARHFRDKGATVVLGGPHVTLLPDEAAEHCDAVVVGFAEKTWPRLLRDFTAGTMRARYDPGDGDDDLSGLPPPRRDLQKKMSYMIPNTVFATRGCRSVCDFCTVPAARYGWYKRPVSDVIDDIGAIGRKRFVFNDVNIAEEPEYAKELFKALIPLKKSWGGLASTRILEDPELIELMFKSGCVYLLIGFESFNDHSLSAIHKSFNQSGKYRELVNTLHGYGIVVMGCFIFGFDHDRRDVFAETVDLVDELRIDIPRYAIYTPYPQTPAFTRLEREGRILHRNWEYYDTQHVVFMPHRMTPLELDEGFKWAYKKTFSLRSNLLRTRQAGKNFPIAFFGNLAYKIYIRRLFSGRRRFPPELLNGSPSTVSMD